MTRDEFGALRTAFNDDCEAALMAKGPEYTRGTDCLENFKRVGGALGVSPLVAWALFANKHFDAILSYVRTGKVHSEPIQGRFADLRNYLDLGLALVKEQERSP